MTTVEHFLDIATRLEQCYSIGIHGIAAVEPAEVRILAQRYRRMEQERSQALEILATQSGDDLLDACRQVKQVAISERDNSEKADAQIAKHISANEQIGKAFEKCLADCSRAEAALTQIRELIPRDHRGAVDCFTDAAPNIDVFERIERIAVLSQLARRP